MNSLNKAIALDPSFLEALYNKGMILFWTQKQNAAALASLEESLKINPNFLKSLYLKAYILFTKAEIDGALVIYS